MLGLLAVTLACAVAQPASPSPSPAAGRMFAVTVRTGPAWDATRSPAAQAHFKEHSANIQRLRASGALVLGGRTGDIGLLLVRAASEAEARALFDADPSIAAGTFRLDVAEWRTFAPGCAEASPSGPRPSPR